MPIHDWTRVIAGTFHDFHLSWTVELSRALNARVLPAGSYAMVEPSFCSRGPDVLTLEGPTREEEASDPFDCQGSRSAVAIAERPPKVRHHVKAEIDVYAQKASVIAIRHASSHKVIAMLEIVSPGNKSSPRVLSQFVDKASDFVRGGIHLMVIDLFPPGRHDPQGIHSAIWEDVSGESFLPPGDQPLTLASYVASGIPEAYVEPTSVGTALIDMPLFLTAGSYVPVPLEATYQSAWGAVPAVWRRTIEEGNAMT